MDYPMDYPILIVSICLGKSIRMNRAKTVFIFAFIFISLCGGRRILSNPDCMHETREPCVEIAKTIQTLTSLHKIIANNCVGN